jgi:hypothetical protein
MGIEFLLKSPYHENADEFVRRTTVTAPAGGEMSGLMAHFLFAAFLEWIRPEVPTEPIENKGKPWESFTGSATGIDGSQVGRNSARGAESGRLTRVERGGD